MPMLSLLLSSALIAQDPAPGPQFQLVNGIAATVNDRPITLGALGELLSLRRSQVPISSPQELIELRQEVLEEMVEADLAIQAGQDRGFAVEIIDMQVDSMFSRQTLERGLLGQASYLSQRGLSRDSATNDLRERVYADLWVRSLVGMDAGPTGRPIRDRHVRPGELQQHYTENQAALGEPTQVRLQMMLLGSAQAGGSEPARAYCNQLRTEVESGQTELTQLIRDLSPLSQNDGILGAMAVIDLPAELRSWATEAELSSLSAVYPELDPERPNADPTGWRFFRLLEREEGEQAPPFLDSAVQTRLFDMVRRVREERLLVFERTKLRSQSEVWNRF